MFFPYGNSANLLFYGDKDCGLNQVYELYKNGDRDGAFRMMDQNLQQCKSGGKDKALARAYYDAGVLHCVQKDYDGANDLFKNAMDSKGAEAVATASSSCQQAQSGATQLKAYRERLDQIPAPSPISATSPPVSAQAPTKPPAPIAQDQAGPNVAKTASPVVEFPSVEERLKKLDGLYKRGLITKKDYDEKKAQILKDL